MSTGLIVLSGLGFITWAVYLGGLASVQERCGKASALDGFATANLNGVDGFNSFWPCSKIFGFSWFIMAWQFVMVIALGGCAAMGKIKQYKTAFACMFTIGTLLYIEMSRNWVPVQDVGYYQDDQAELRARAVAAGAIMTAIVNGLIVIWVGSDCEECTTNDNDNQNAKAAQEPANTA